MKRRLVPVTLLLLAAAAAPSLAGVVNPNISVIGQPFIHYTDDPADPSHDHTTLNLGEVEAMFDAYLNPYASGTFVLSFADGGVEVEEGYFQLFRGLPGGLTMKGGKYRMGFGKLNPQHPHAVPFADRFRVLTYLPGDEALNETAVQLSERIPAPGDFSLTASVDWMQGDSFRIERAPSGAANDPLFTETGDNPEASRAAFLARLSGFQGIGDRSGLELGLSATRGTNNVAAETHTMVFGADAKAKLWTAPFAYLVLQGEYLHSERENAGWDSTAVVYTSDKVKSNGGYFYADYNFKTRYNVGAGYERYQQPVADGPWDKTLKAWVGFALLEETTAFRLDWDHFMPGTPDKAPTSPDAINNVTLRVIFSMGPHKAHVF
jgi:hypothetical protein